MKKTIFSVLSLLLILMIFFCSCDKPGDDHGDESGSGPDTDDTESNPSETDSGTEDVPYMGINYEIWLLAENNPGLAFDVMAYLNDKAVYFFLPSDVPTDSLTYTIYDSGDNICGTYTADFNDKTISENEQIFVGIEKLNIKVLQTELPSVSIDINDYYKSFESMNSDKSKKTKCYGNMIISVPEAYAEKFGYSRIYKSTENDSGSPETMSVKGRGNSSWTEDKKSYTVSLEKKTNILGMGKVKDWVLISNHADRTLLRNMIMYETALDIGLEYSVECRSVELYVDGEYYGTYLLCKKLEIGNNRIEINDLEEENEAINDDIGKGKATEETLSSGVTIKYWSNIKNPEDITGGYLVKIDLQSRAVAEPSWFKTKKGIYYVIKSPDYVSYEEARYIAELFQDFEDAVYSEDGYNRKGIHYTRYIDMESFVTRYVLDEISRNADGSRTSTFFYKDRNSEDPLIYSGPVWDYDLAFGNYINHSDAEGWEVRDNYYYEQLFMYDEFYDEVVRQYKKVSVKFRYFADEGIDDLAKSISAAAKMNFARWDVLGRTELVSPSAAGESIYGSIKYLKDFLEDRLDWLDKELLNE